MTTSLFSIEDAVTKSLQKRGYMSTNYSIIAALRINVTDKYIAELESRNTTDVLPTNEAYETIEKLIPQAIDEIRHDFDKLSTMFSTYLQPTKKEHIDQDDYTGPDYVFRPFDE